MNLKTGEVIKVLPQHIFGRNPVSANTLLNSPDISRIHATITWDGECWHLFDSSTNGTYVRGKRLRRGEGLCLRESDKLHFANNKEDIWQLLDCDAPTSLLIPETPDCPTIELKSIAVLPTEDNPEITLYLSPLGQWLCESQSGIRVLNSGDWVDTADCAWRFIEAMPCITTQALPKQPRLSRETMEVHFAVSQNEEHVAAQLQLSEHKFDLGERTHHYLLLMLARKRLDDTRIGIADTERGWMEKEQLGQQLGMSENHINIQVYRFRKQLLKALPATTLLPQLIERRNGELRFVVDNVVINGVVQ